MQFDDALSEATALFENKSTHIEVGRMAGNNVYFLTVANHLRFVLKVFRKIDRMNSEYRALELLKNQKLVTPELYAVGKNWILYEYIDGNPILEKDHVRMFYIVDHLDRLSSCANDFSFPTLTGKMICNIFRFSYREILQVPEFSECQYRIGQLIRRMSQILQRSKMIFSNGDLRREHVLENVRGDLSVIDWERAQFEPVIWSLASLCYSVPDNIMYERIRLLNFQLDEFLIIKFAYSVVGLACLMRHDIEDIGLQFSRADCEKYKDFVKIHAGNILQG